MSARNGLAAKAERRRRREIRKASSWHEVKRRERSERARAVFTLVRGLYRAWWAL